MAMLVRLYADAVDQTRVRTVRVWLRAHGLSAQLLAPAAVATWLAAAAFRLRCPIYAPRVGGTPVVFVNCAAGCLKPLGDVARHAQIMLDGFAQPERLAAATRAVRVRFLRDFQTLGVAGRRAARLVDALCHG